MLPFDVDLFSPFFDMESPNSDITYSSDSIDSSDITYRGDISDNNDISDSSDSSITDSINWNTVGIYFSPFYNSILLSFIGSHLGIIFGHFGVTFGS